MRGGAEAQQGEAGDRPRAHRENVAQNAADAGRRALIRLDKRRVVVALHLEDAGVAVADVDHSGVFAGPPDHPWRRGRQFAQMQPRRFIGTMFVPHRRENPEFGETGDAADQREDALVFVRLEPVGGDERVGYFRFVKGQNVAPRVKSRNYAQFEGVRLSGIRRAGAAKSRESAGFSIKAPHGPWQPVANCGQSDTLPEKRASTL